jgi:hypothetical protein
MISCALAAAFRSRGLVVCSLQYRYRGDEPCQALVQTNAHFVWIMESDHAWVLSINGLLSVFNTQACRLSRQLLIQLILRQAQNQ